MQINRASARYGDGSKGVEGFSGARYPFESAAPMKANPPRPPS
jgi:hypothetical protein